VNPHCLSHFASKSVGGLTPRRQGENNKVTKLYVSHIPLKVPTDPIATKFGLVAYFMDVINCAKFHFNPLRGFDFVEGPKFGLYLLILHAEW